MYENKNGVNNLQTCSAGRGSKQQALVAPLTACTVVCMRACVCGGGWGACRIPCRPSTKLSEHKSDPRTTGLPLVTLNKFHESACVTFDETGRTQSVAHCPTVWCDRPEKYLHTGSRRQTHGQAILRRTVQWEDRCTSTAH
jgi:hypothetical protein